MNPYAREFMKRRVAIYARVSTEHEAQLSALENQIDWYKPLLELHPEWTLVGQYIDEGITGTSAEKRPQFMQMIEDAKKHRFDMIITREVSRFARNTVDTLQYTRMLREHGVEVYFINDGIKTFDGDGELRLTIMATLAQDESRKTSIRVKSGQQTSMNNGVVYGNGNILGYDRMGKQMVINPEQARTVRLIYDMYLDGCGLMKIKDELELRGYKTSQGKDKWFPTVISHVLKNSFYCGIITYHKEYVKDYLKQKKVKNYGEIEFTQVQGTHEPIVTVEEFERVQRIMETKRTGCKNLNTGPRTKGKKPRTTVWGKLLICECGHTFNTKKWDRDDRHPGNAYQCYDSVRTGSYERRKKKGLPLDGICQSPMIPEWRLQMMANLIFRKYLSEKDKVLALANSILEAHIGDTEEQENTAALLEAKQKELERLHKKLDAYIEMRSEGELSRELFKSKCSEIEPKIQQLQEDIEKLSMEAEHREVIDYTEKLTVLQYALEQYTHIDESRDVPESVIEAFVVKIVVSKDGFDWYLRFNGDPDKPLYCQLQGKRRTNTKIMVAGDISPAMDSGTTGCYQGLIIPFNTNCLSFGRGSFFAVTAVNLQSVSNYGIFILEERMICMNYQRPSLPYYRLAQAVSHVVATCVFKTKILRNEIKDVHGPFIVIANHQAAYDFVSLIGASKRPMSFVISNSFYQSLPIQGILDKMAVIPKQQFQTTANDLKKIRSVTQAGEPVVIYPAGLMCEDGISTPIPAATYKLFKWLGVDVYMAKISGTYFAMPKWTSGFRPGTTTLDIYKLFSKEELPSLDQETIRTRTEEALDFDAYREQEQLLVKYKKGSNIRGLENVLYSCPHCGAEFSITVQEEHILRCARCGYAEVSDEFGFLHKISDHGPEIRYVSDWSRMIHDALKETLARGEDTVLSARTAIHMVDPKKKKYVPVGGGTVTLSPEQFLIEGTLRGEAVSLTIPTAGFPTLPFSPGKYIEIQDGKTIYRCVLEDGRLAMKFINMVKIFFELKNP